MNLGASYEQNYECLTRPLRKNAHAVSVFIGASKLLTLVGYIMYPLLLVLVVFQENWLDLAKFIIVPALGFIVLSVFRSRYNAPRPYEAYAIDPLIVKETKGRSFPSRHTFSLMMIALLWLEWNVPVGIVLVILACLMAFMRVVGGVHFPRDVIAGALFALLCAGVGNYCFVVW